MEEQIQNNSSNKTLERALQLLKTFAVEGKRFNVAEISRYLGITRVTAQSLINTLEACNYVEKDPETGRYSMGYMMFVLGNRYIYQYPFLHAAEKLVSDFSNENQIKVNVSVLKPDGNLLILLTKDLSLIPMMAVGSLVPANVAASGKVLMAFTPEEERKTILKQMTFPQMTPYSITDRDVYLDQLEQTRKRYFATEFDELLIGNGCIASPIFDRNGTAIAAVSVSTKVHILQENLDIYTEKVVNLARTISAGLGYQIF